MNKDNAKDFLPLVQALADGKLIQIARVTGEWVDLGEEVRFGAHPAEYRIKPEPREPREIFLALDDEDLAYWDEARARSVAGPDGKVSRYREVIE